MKLVRLQEIRKELLADEDNLTEGKKVLLKELNYLHEQGILSKE